MGHDGGLERDDGGARLEGVLDFGGDFKAAILMLASAREEMDN